MRPIKVQLVPKGTATDPIRGQLIKKYQGRSWGSLAKTNALKKMT